MVSRQRFTTFKTFIYQQFSENVLHFSLELKRMKNQSTCTFQPKNGIHLCFFVAELPAIPLVLKDNTVTVTKRFSSIAAIVYCWEPFR